jgi:hypothetical protein
MRYAATAAEAAANNVLLAKGELGYAEDANVLKVGNGVEHWNDLEALTPPGGGGGGGAELDAEGIQDLVGLMFTGATHDGLSSTYSDGAATITLAVLSEKIQDIVGAMVTGNTETGISVTYDDAAGTLSFASTITQYTDEMAQDTIAALLAAGTHTGITVTYNDGAGTLSLASTVTQYTDEMAQDAAAAMITGATHSGLTVSYNDGSNTLAFTTALVTEDVQDIVGGMVAGNTETGLAVTYDDAAGKLNFVATATSLLEVLEPALAPPASPNAKDDEFDGTSSVTWSNTPTTAGTVSLNTYVPGKLYIGSASTANVVGRVQAIPAGYPFTITTRISDAMLNANFHQAGIVVTTASPTGSSNAVIIGPQYSGGAVGGLRWSGTMGGTFASAGGLSKYINPPVWFRATFASATSLTTSASADGVNWVTMESAFNPGFTPGVMGLAVSAATVVNMHAVFDFFRIT